LDDEEEVKVMTEEQKRIMKEKAKNLIIRTASVIEMLKETYYPGHSTTAKRVIERHLIREFGLKPETPHIMVVL